MSKIKNWSKSSKGRWKNDESGKTLKIVKEESKLWTEYSIKIGKRSEPGFQTYEKAHNFAVKWMRNHSKG